LNALGWFLREEGNGPDKRYHFHFSITNDNLTNTTPEIVCRYLTKQWKKIGHSLCQIDPWNQTKTPLGVWYLTQMAPYPVPYSRYFNGDNCHWKMSTLLHSKILQLATERLPMKNKPNTIQLKKNPLPKGTFLAGDTLYPFSQFKEVLVAQLGSKPLPRPKCHGI
jgi:hypothetical protein